MGFAVVHTAEGSEGDPNWWRLKCNSTTTVRWQLCHVSFFADSTCKRAPPARLLERVYSPAHGAPTWGLPVDAVFTEWASKCEQCERGEAFLGVKFSRPVVIQCVRFTDCWGVPSVVSTTTPQVMATSTSSEGRGGGSTMVASVTTTNTINQILQQLGGADAWNRRLGSASCTSLMLERSADGAEWSFVAEWSSPNPDTDLSLASAQLRPLQIPPMVMSWDPAAVSCSDCGRANVHGVQASHILEVTFSEAIHFGVGKVVVERGGMDTVFLDPSMDGDWFRVFGNRLQVLPQAPLGTSSSCSRLTFQEEAIQNADGQYLLPGSPYSICIADTVAPQLKRSDPHDGAVNLGLSPQILLEFNEEVQVAFDPASARLVPSGSATAQALKIDLDDTSKVEVHACSYCALQGWVEISVDGPLEPETRYELQVPSGAIADRSGNPWPGDALGFTTECKATGCAVMREPPMTTSTPEDETDGQELRQQGVVLGVIGMALALCFFAGWCACKKFVGSCVVPWRKGLGASKVEQAPSGPTPAWVAKSGSSTTGWRRTQVQPGSAGQGRGGGDSPLNTSTSSSFGFSGVSRVTAATPAGPRQAAWVTPQPEAAGRHTAGPGPQQPQAQQQRRAAGAAGGAPTAKPPSEPTAAQKRRAQTEEDVKKRPTEGEPNTGSFAQAGKKGSFTEDNATSGGWVRTTDAASGRTYWYHYKTRETRWDEPPRPGHSPPRAKEQAAPKAGPAPEPKAAAPEPKAPPEPKRAPRQEAPPQSSSRPQTSSASSAKSQAKAPPPVAKAAAVASPTDNSKAARVRAEVNAQLETTRKEDIVSRKKTFRFLCLQWHPDKNQEDVELATEVFQFLQQQRDWYLKE